MLRPRQVRCLVHVRRWRNIYTNRMSAYQALLRPVEFLYKNNQWSQTLDQQGWHLGSSTTVTWILTLGKILFGAHTHTYRDKEASPQSNHSEHWPHSCINIAHTNVASPHRVYHPTCSWIYKCAYMHCSAAMAMSICLTQYTKITEYMVSQSSPSAYAFHKPKYTLQDMHAWPRPWAYSAHQSLCKKKRVKNFGKTCL